MYQIDTSLGYSSNELWQYPGATFGICHNPLALNGFKVVK